MTYERDILIWPIGKVAEKEVYADAADAAYAAYTGVPGDIFVNRNKLDRHGQHVTAYFGPTGLGSAEDPGPAEPPECLAARADAVLATHFDEAPEV